MTHHDLAAQAPAWGARRASIRSPSTLWHRLCAATFAGAVALTLALQSLPSSAQVAAASASGSSQAANPPGSGDETVLPYRVKVSQAALADLRGRLAATRWPDKETVTDQSQGAKLVQLQELVRYWATDYDWRKAEAKLNAYPQFKTKIDGVDIHFIHVKSRHPNAMPLIITHGWPGSVFEQIKLIGPLTDPTRYGARTEDAFDVVIPSLPGFGFSGRPTEAGWGLERIGNSWALLMKRLGYKRYVAQGGIGEPVSSRRWGGKRHRAWSASTPISRQ